MPNITSGVNLGSTVYRQITSGANPYFNQAQTYSVPSYPNIGGSNNPFRKPASSSMPLGASRPVMPVATPTDASQPKPQFDMAQAYKTVQDAANSVKLGDGGIRDATMDQQAQQVTNDLQSVANAENPEAAMNAVRSQPFYQKEGFADAMMGIGLSVMSGASPLQAFQAGNEAAQQGKQEEKLDTIRNNAKANESSLLQQYTPDSVANYIATGDASQLRERQLSLEEKRQQQLEDQATQDQREDQRADRADQRQQRNFDYQLKRQDQSQIAAENRAQARLDAADQKADQKVYTDITNNTMKLNKTLQRNDQQRIKGFDSSLTTLDNYFKPGASDTEKQAALQLASETAFNAIQGSSTAEKTQDKINDMLGQPGLINVVGGKISWATGIPRDQQAKYLQTLLKMDKNSWKKTYDDSYLEQADANIPEGADDTTKKRILASISKGAGRKLTLDDYNSWYDKTYGGGEETPSTRGTLSSGNTSTPTVSAAASSVLDKYKIKH
ncbi:TPA: hypothetical protein M2Q89_000692 [Escherichia coli]|nr:hypothetical protein [Escherichia coli]